MVETSPYSIPREPGRWRAITLAVVMHALLVALLWVGVRWQSEEPATIEAEVWNLEAKEAAPRAQPPEPLPKVEPKIVPKPAPEPEVEKPDIALEQEKKRKELQRKEEERLAEAEKKAEAERLKKELAEKKKRKEARDAEQIAKLREEEMRRINAGTGGTGEAPKSQGIQGDPSYIAKIMQKIKSNTAFAIPGDLQGNPAVEYEVNLFPDGSLKGPPRKKKPSGVPGFDEAVLRAIELSVPFPPNKSGTVPSSLLIVHKPKDN